MATSDPGSPGSPVKCVGIATINVHDADAAIGFWRDRMGFELRSDQPYGEGARWIELGPRGAETALTLTTPENRFWREPGGYANVIFATDDIDAAHEELSGRGVKFEGPVMRMEGGPPPMAFFSDQDGNRFLLAER